MYDEMFAFEVPTSRGIIRIVGPANILQVEAEDVGEIIKRVLALIVVPPETPLGVTLVPPETDGTLIRARLPRRFTNGPQLRDPYPPDET